MSRQSCLNVFAKTGFALALFAAMAVANQANAEDYHLAAPAIKLRPEVRPTTPRIGIEAFSSGNYVEVTRTFYGTPADRLGLEAGDRILQVNGHAVRSISDLQRYLQDAAYLHSGQICVLVDNVRARYGQWGSQRYVSRTTYLDGFAHLAGFSTGPGTIVVTSQASATAIATRL